MKRSKTTLPRVLIVTPPEPDSALLSALSGRGWTVSCRDRTDDTLEKICRQEFDLVVLDLDGNGAEIDRWLRRLQERPRPASVIITGERPTPEEGIRFLREGAFDFLIKPVTLARMLESIDQGVESRRAFLQIMSLSDRLQTANESLIEQKACIEQERDLLIKRNHDLGLLNRIELGLVGSLHADEIVQEALAGAADLIPYDLAALAWLHGERAWGSASDGEDHGLMIAYRQTALERARMHADFLAAHGPLLTLSEDQREVEVILLAAGQRLGLMRLMRRPQQPCFNTYETEILSALANTLALALRGADTHQEIQSLAVTDELTSLLNRRAFNSALHREFKKSARYGQSLGLLLLDIDHFKAINDRFGHPAGDSVLRQVAVYLGQTIRTVDVAARYGGEEFTVLMPGTGPGQAIAAAERIRHAILDHTFLPECRDYRVTISIGVAPYHGEGGCTPEDMIRDVDMALYRAKTNGRNRVEVAAHAGVLFSPATQSLQPTVQ